MDHTEARAELDALLQAAQDVLPGEWDVSDSGARTCTLPSGERGVDYALTRFYGRGVPVESQREVLDSVIALWSETEYAPTEIVRDPVDGIVATEIVYPASGVDENGLSLSFALTTRGVAVGGQSRCAVGDARELGAG